MRTALKRLILMRGGFSPATIPGLQLWLDASDASTLFQDSAGTTPAAANNDPIGYWGDKSGNGRNVTQASTPIKPTLSVATPRRVVFSGSQFLGGASTQLVGSDGTWTAFAVARARTGAATGIILHQDPPLVARVAQQLRMAATAADTVTFNTVAAFFTDNNSAAMSAETWYILQASRADASIEMIVNGATNGAATTTGTPANAATTFEIGARASAVYLSGDIAEIIAFNRVLDSSEVTAIRTYLNSKWAVY